ncbi:MAG: histidine phosphatase family protein [Candidatus Obscuribacterales bacterium]|nr:histidine phosphatase family protein [Candidatus Obscuribacterales bacterium]
MTINLYLLRHGETEFSKGGGFCGNTDIALTESGKQMAEQFADAYDKFPWQDIYCSPSKRAVDTALPLATRLGLELKKRDGLKEIDYGEWEGLTLEYVLEHQGAEYAKWESEPGWNSPPGGETAYEIASRAMRVISEVIETHKKGNVLVVSHKATIRIIICNLLGIELGRYRDRIDIPAASLSLLKFSEHGPMLQTLACRSHLSPALRDRPGT